MLIATSRSQPTRGSTSTAARRLAAIKAADGTAWPLRTASFGYERNERGQRARRFATKPPIVREDHAAVYSRDGISLMHEPTDQRADASATTNLSIDASAGGRCHPPFAIRAISAFWVASSALDWLPEICDNSRSAPNDIGANTKPVDAKATMTKLAAANFFIIPLP